MTADGSDYERRARKGEKEMGFRPRSEFVTGPGPEPTAKRRETDHKKRERK